MKIRDLYTPFIDEIGKTKDLNKALGLSEEFSEMREWAVEWGIDLAQVEQWVLSAEYELKSRSAREFLKKAPQIVSHVENIFGVELKGEVRLSPSLKRFDGFARYDAGYHAVLFGVDHPDADEEYLSALMAHELSHVYRDHQPEVWKHLEKPLEKVTRAEYLDAMDATEHLVSEGLATLFSQLAYSKVPEVTHHYYFAEEMKWCVENDHLIDKAMRECLKADQDVWSFYGEGRVAPGSPGRTQYFWAARQIMRWLAEEASLGVVTHPMQLGEILIRAHGMPARDFACFQIK